MEKHALTSGVAHDSARDLVHAAIKELASSEQACGLQINKYMYIECGVQAHLLLLLLLYMVFLLPLCEVIVNRSEEAWRNRSSSFVFVSSVVFFRDSHSWGQSLGQDSVKKVRCRSRRLLYVVLHTSEAVNKISAALAEIGEVKLLSNEDHEKQVGVN